MSPRPFGPQAPHQVAFPRDGASTLLSTLETSSQRPLSSWQKSIRIHNSREGGNERQNKLLVKTALCLGEGTPVRCYSGAAPVSSTPKLQHVIVFTRGFKYWLRQTIQSQNFLQIEKKKPILLEGELGFTRLKTRAFYKTQEVPPIHKVPQFTKPLPKAIETVFACLFSPGREECLQWKCLQLVQGTQ